MAETVYGSYFSTSGASNHLRPYIEYTITTNSTSISIVVNSGCNIKSGYYTTAKLTGTATATDYANATYSRASGGTQWKAGSHQMGSRTLTYTRTTAAQNKTLTYKLASSVGSSTVTVTIPVPALDQYALSYNANGGGNAPASHSLYYGVAGTVTTSVPTYTGYKFLGWANSAVAKDSGTVNYASGASITITANKTLYASWKTDVAAPKVNSIKAYRVASNASGYAPSPLSSGTKAYFEISTDLGTNVNFTPAPTASYTINGSSTTGSVFIKDPTGGISGKIYYGYFDNELGISARYTLGITITVVSTQSSTVTTTFSATTFISPEKYVWDIANDGMRFAFGRKSTHNDTTTQRSDFVLEIEGSIDVSANMFLDLINYTTSGTTDKALYDAIVALGWNSEVIV